MSVHSTDAFRHATELVGTEIWSFYQHAQFYFAERRGLSLFSCWKSHHENAEENSTAYERLSRAVYQFFAHLKISTYQLHAGIIFTQVCQMCFVKIPAILSTVPDLSCAVIRKRHRENRETNSVVKPQLIIFPYFGWLVAFRCVCDVTIAPRNASTAANKLPWRNCPDKIHY